MRKKTMAVAFRLPVSELTLLTEEAAKYGLSPGSYARRLVLQAITDTDRLRLFDELTELRQTVLRLRDDLGTATIALLADAGKASAEEATEFVKAKLGR
jgi:hypothetical protein